MLFFFFINQENTFRGSYQSFSIKKVFVKISKNSQESTGARASFKWSCRLKPATLFKKRLWHKCFPVKFTKFLGTPFLQNTSGRLLMFQQKIIHWTHQFTTKNLKKDKKKLIWILNFFVRPFMSSFVTTFQNRKPQLYSWSQFTFLKKQFPYGFVH